MKSSTPTESLSSSSPWPPSSCRKRGCAELRDQLDRASISIVLNIAEGCGRRSPADKARFYSMARGSATECAAILDLLGVRGLVDDRLRKRARALLVRVVQMLTRLVARKAASHIAAMSCDCFSIPLRCLANPDTP
jgi:four helix bundle protein